MNREEKITVLFQGDSITDAGRIREDDFDLGSGYAMMVASLFSAKHPKRNMKFLNRGIGGDRVKDLKNRWVEDCINLNPTIVSILVGINDCWRRYDSNDPTTVEKFREDYKFILQQLRLKTDAVIILCEPYVLPVPDDRKKWRKDLDPKINVVRELAREFDTYLLPLDGILNQVSVYKEPSFWTPDGVHPSNAGHALIAKELLNFIEDII